MRLAVVLSGAAIVLVGCRSGESTSAPTPPSASNVAEVQHQTQQAPVSTDAISRELVLYVEGLTCEGCAWQIRETLQKVDGIADIRTTVANKRVVVTYDPRRATSATASRTLEERWLQVRRGSTVTAGRAARRLAPRLRSEQGLRSVR